MEDPFRILKKVGLGLGLKLAPFAGGVDISRSCVGGGVGSCVLMVDEGLSGKNRNSSETVSGMGYASRPKIVCSVYYSQHQLALTTNSTKEEHLKSHLSIQRLQWWEVNSFSASSNFS